MKRKAGLGYYNATRAEWKSAYRHARERYQRGLHPDPKTKGIIWKAQLIVSYERNAIDPLDFTPEENRSTRKLIDEILKEMK
jgi:hypothetical protein